jgi:sodium-dependent phosphate transporter
LVVFVWRLWGRQAKEEKKKDMKYWKDTCLKVVDEETAKELAEAAGQEAVHITEHVTPEQGDAIYYFKYMLVFVAALESFAHGANDTANATGAFSAVMLTWENGIDDCSDAGTPVWVMAVAGACVFAGVVTLGWRVIMTIGFSLTQARVLLAIVECFVIQNRIECRVVLALIIPIVGRITPLA